jgi:LCP family protein required for cell wall assembly
MRTTLKRRIGRWEQVSGNGRSASSPRPRSRINHYQQPAASGRVLRVVGHFFLNLLLAVAIIAGGAAGGVYLWAHQSISKTAASSADVTKSQGQLALTSAGEPVIALVIGYDHRAGMGGDPGRSDTIMLIRADPRKESRSISLLSFPRDLRVPLYCEADYSYATGKINSAYASCGAEGVLLTVKALTGLPINYNVTVNFRGFKQIVSRVGGVWLDIDRRYYVSEAENYATINLHPGYQRLSGSNALDYVRYRHGDSDFVRIARQQSFIRSFRQQTAKLSLTDYAGIINAISENVEVGNKAGGSIPMKTLLGYADLARNLPEGALIQTKIENIYEDSSSSDQLTSQSDIDAAVAQFANPDLTASARAASQNRVARTKPTVSKAPEPKDTSVLVLNAAGVEGLATNTSIALSQREYKVVEPAGGVIANYPGEHLWHSVVYYDPAQPRSKAAAEKLADYIDAPTVTKIVPKIARLANGAMVVLALGETYSGTLPPIVTRIEVPAAQPPRVRVDPGVTASTLRRLQKRFSYRLYLPSRVESSSYLDSDSPRVYWLKRKERTLRITFQVSGYATGYWAIQETKWADAPVLADTHYTRRIGGRSYDFYYQGAHLHMVVLRAQGATYWVVNTIDDMLSNETMISIAKGLRPVGGDKGYQGKKSKKSKIRG